VLGLPPSTGSSVSLSVLCVLCGKTPLRQTASVILSKAPALSEAEGKNLSG